MTEGQFPKVDGDADYASEGNIFWSGVLSSGLNHVRQLMDRSVEYSAQSDLWGEAYIDADGRNESVVYSDDGLFYNPSENYYFAGVIDESSGDTTHDPDSITNPENAFDYDKNTMASNSASGDGELETSLGKTFTTPRNIKKIVIDVHGRAGRGAGTSGFSWVEIRIETYDGSDWSEEKFYRKSEDSAQTDLFVVDELFLNKSVEGVRVRIICYPLGSTTRFARFRVIAYGDEGDSGNISHGITGKTEEDIFNSLLTPYMYSKEENYNVQYKLIELETSFSNETIQDPNDFTNPENFFDEDLGTYASNELV